jgi:hypothetical protein
LTPAWAVNDLFTLPAFIFVINFTHIFPVRQLPSGFVNYPSPVPLQMTPEKYSCGGDYFSPNKKQSTFLHTKFTDFLIINRQCECLHEICDLDN